MHMISMQSNGAASTLFGSGSGQIRRRISGHLWLRPDFKNFNLVHLYQKCPTI